MITKVDHLQLSSTDFVPPGRLLGALGYAKRFEERGLRNLQVKKRHLTYFSDRQDLALFEMAGSIGIEMVDNGRLGEAEGSFTPVLDSLPAGVPTKRGPEMIANGESFDSFSLEGIEAPVCVRKGGGGPPALKEIILRVTEPARSAGFWQELGFRAGPEGRMVHTGVPGGQRLTLNIVEGRRDTPPRLDDRGFPALALVSSNAPKERERLSAAGVPTGPTERIDVNGRSLEVFFCAGPGGELVELIGLAR